MTPDRMGGVVSVAVVVTYDDLWVSCRVVTMTVTGMVWSTGPRTLECVDGPRDDGDDRRLVREPPNS